MSVKGEDIAEPILVTVAELSAESLAAVIESFVLREGTDYGSTELSLEQKILNIRKKIDKKEILLVFDPNTESVTFLTVNEWLKFKSKNENNL